MTRINTALITFEGTDGSGKSTQFRFTCDYLETKGYRILPIREPGGTPLGEQIREVLLHGQDMVKESELLLYMAARAENYRTVIRPAFGEYDFILSDRSIDSSTAYQGYARGIPVQAIKWLNYFSTDGITPTVTYLCDIDSELAATRMGNSRDRIEKEGVRFQKKVRQGFLELAADEPTRFVIINAWRSKEECFEVIRDDLCRRFLFNQDL